MELNEWASVTCHGLWLCFNKMIIQFIWNSSLSCRIQFNNLPRTQFLALRGYPKERILIHMICEFPKVKKKTTAIAKAVDLRQVHDVIWSWKLKWLIHQALHAFGDYRGILHGHLIWLSRCQEICKSLEFGPIMGLQDTSLSQIISKLYHVQGEFRLKKVLIWIRMGFCS